MMLGEVDRVDDHFIATKFVGLLLPVSSMYVTSVSSSYSGNRSTMTWSGVPVRFNFKSAALAYPRVWLHFLAVAWPFITHWGQNVNAMTTKDWLPSIAMIAVGLLALIPGRLSEREKRRLRVLGSVTGLSLDPSKLQSFTRETRLQFLEDTARARGLPTTAEGCAAAAKDAPREALPLLYTLARYAGDTPAWRAAADAVLARLEAPAAA